ncbi:hypothetical protein CQ14_21300 [Bradyrhizobium lablabi]|uniref:DNA ligase OB-like domain-containing protein n=1 Tax=Bradyrhizobium lablabi TaxID=722472 RepID=A0A0R3N9X1_9BRAD|nr:hypothetical protein [Bradyrhizobium lablabi]KRR26214.1 hypothetical protein CQ14_21300 [Bradyrhizobium lablabi]
MTIDEINKPIPWNGKALDGVWSVTFKVDGVRAVYDGRGWFSRAGKPLYNIPPWIGGARDCEVFVNSFRDTIRATRTVRWKSNTPPIRHEHLFGLDILDPRLDNGTLHDPTAQEIRAALEGARTLGFEGLVLRQGDCWLKVKPEETYDVEITGFVEGRGKHGGRLGLVTTPLGDVGSGFSDEQRTALWADAQAGTLVGQVIEVSCMMLTAAGMFRHPRFVRMRPDKLPAVPMQEAVAPTGI